MFFFTCLSWHSWKPTVCINCDDMAECQQFPLSGIVHTPLPRIDTGRNFWNPCEALLSGSFSSSSNILGSWARCMIAMASSSMSWSVVAVFSWFFVGLSFVSCWSSVSSLIVFSSLFAGCRVLVPGSSSFPSRFPRAPPGIPPRYPGACLTSLVTSLSCPPRG